MSEIFQKIYDCLQGNFPEKIKPKYKAIIDEYNISNFKNDIPKPPIKYEFELDSFQKKAAYRISNYENVFIAAHTSSGKTVAAEWAIAQTLTNHRNIIYTSPIKALSNQKYRDFKTKFSKESYLQTTSTPNVGIITGDVQVNEKAHCLVMTTEILRNMIYKDSDYLQDVDWIIFDEIHYMNDNERGRVWEEIIQMASKHISMIFLSATTPNAIEFSNWVAMAREKPVFISQTFCRPIPINHYLNTGNTQESISQYYEEKIEKEKVVNESIKVKTKQDGIIITKPQEYIKISKTTLEKQDIDDELTNKDKCFMIVENQKLNKENLNIARELILNKTTRKVKHKTKKITDQFFKKTKFSTKINYLLNLFKLLKLKDKLPVIAFAFSRKGCETYCNELSSLDFTTKKDKFQIKQFINDCLQLISEKERDLPQINYVSNLLIRGIGIHHSGLLPILKEIVEIMFQNGLIQVLFATETFAMGVNMPARTVLFTSLEKHDGTQFRTLLPGEYTQMAGRAGRRGYDESGTVIILAYDDVPDNIEKIVTGKPLLLESKYYLTYQTILSILQLSKHNEDMSITHLLRNSYGEHQLTMNFSQLQYSNTVLLESKNIYKKLVRLSKLSTKQIKQLDNFYESMEIILPFMEKLHETTFTTLHIGPKKQRKLLTNKRIILVTPENENIFPVPMIVINFNEYELNCVYLSDYIKVQDNADEKQLLFKRTIPICFKWIIGITTTCLDDFTEISKLKLVGKKQVLLSNKLDMKKYNDYKGEFDNILFKNISIGFPIKNLLEFKLARQRVKLRYLIQDLHYSISDKTLHLMPDYNIKRNVLIDLYYLDTDNIILLKGKIAKEINTCHELLLTECIVDGIFRNLSNSMITALLSMFIAQVNTKQKITKENILSFNSTMGEKVLYIETKIIPQILSIQSKYGDKQDVFDFKKKNFNPALLFIVYQWCEGKTFHEISKQTDIMEGTIVRSMLRLIETLLEVKKIAEIIENTALQQQMEECVVLVKRDIVYTESLYIT